MLSDRLLALGFGALGFMFITTYLLLLFIPSAIIGIPDRSIEIRNLEFIPMDLVVAKGTTINWLNLDSDADNHDVTSGVSVVGRKARGMKQTKFSDGKFQSGVFVEGQTFSVTFQEKGEYKYYCNVHPFMLGTIVVK